MMMLHPARAARVPGPGAAVTGSAPARRPLRADAAAVVDAMLKMARVTGQDVVYDLGCGDGRIPIAAALKYGARGVGIDLDPKRIEDANENAKAAGVTGKVRFVAEDCSHRLPGCDGGVPVHVAGREQRLMPKLKAG